MENLGVTSVHTVRRTNHTSPRQTHQNMEADLRSVSQNYAKEISIMTLPSHRSRDRKSQISPPGLSQLRALNGRLLWLGVQCLPQLLAPLSLLMGQTPKATVYTICEVNKLAGKATVWARMPLKVHAHHSLFVVTDTDAGWTTRPDGTSQGRQLVFIANSEWLQGKESNMSLMSWHASGLRGLAGSSSAAETQAAADGDDDDGPHTLVLERNFVWTARFAKLAIGSKTNSCCFGGGLSWCLRRSSSSCLDLKDKKSGLEALALKQRLVECCTMIRWCHSAAPLGDVVTKESDTARWT